MPNYSVYDVLQKLVDINAKEFGNDHQAAVDAIDAAFGVVHEPTPVVPAQSGGTVANAQEVAAAQTAAGPVPAEPDPVAAAQQAPAPEPEPPAFLVPPPDTSPTAGLPPE